MKLFFYAEYLAVLQTIDQTITKNLDLSLSRYRLEIKWVSIFDNLFLNRKKCSGFPNIPRISLVNFGIFDAFLILCLFQLYNLRTHTPLSHSLNINFWVKFLFEIILAVIKSESKRNYSLRYEILYERVLSFEKLDGRSNCKIFQNMENILFCALKSLKKIIFYVNHIKVGSEKVKIFRPQPKQTILIKKLVVLFIGKTMAFEPTTM